MRYLSFTFTFTFTFTLMGCTPREVGLRAVEGGDLSSGVRSLREAVRRDPGDAEVQRELGLAYLGLADAALAEAHLDKAAQLDQQDRVAWRFLALTRERLGWQVRAVETWEGLLGTHPRDRLSKAFATHLARCKTNQALLTQEAAQNRIESQRDKGLLDDKDLPRPIVVLPFSGPEVYPEYELMGRTLARALATDLAKMDLLWVIGPDEAQRGMAHRGLALDARDEAGSTQAIGKAFGAGLVVRGTLRKGFEGEVRADVVVVDPDPSTLLLDSKTEGTVKQFFTMQREVLDKVLATMGILPSERERAGFGRFATDDVSALGNYLDGVAMLLANEYTRALRALEKSVELDADFPCPHRALAMIYRLQGRKDRAQNALVKGHGRGNPRCAADLDLLVRRIDTDTVVADMLRTDLEQSRTILRNGVQLLFADESAPTEQTLRDGPSGSPMVSPDSLPPGWIWGSESGGLPGTADPSSLGGVYGTGLSAPDPATSGSGGI
jgi:Tfp pilus assembly protein PilF/TolB-like protein